MTDFVTLLRAHDGRRLTKVHRRSGDTWETSSYDSAKWFESRPRGVHDLVMLGELLARLEHRPDICIIRGRLRDGLAGRRVRRAMHGVDAPFVATEHHWACLDIDGLPAPELPRADWLVWLRDHHLPSEFSGAAAVYRWSASAGVKGWSTIRVHLWFWFSRPVCDRSLRRWLKTMPHVDASLANAVQIHYTAAPIFIDAADPLEEPRLGQLEGVECVDPPDSVLGQVAENKRKAAAEVIRVMREREAPHHIRRGAKGYAAAALRNAPQRVLEAGVGDRHRTFVKESISLFGLVKGGILDRSEVIRVMTAAAESALPARRHREIKSALKWAEQRAQMRKI